MVAKASSGILDELERRLDVVPKGKVAYKETLLLHLKGEYGAPELVGIRVFGERDEAAQVVHYGHDIQNQEENFIEVGEKDREVYKFVQLGFLPIGEFEITEHHFRYEEFFVKFVEVKGLGEFIVIERRFPGESTELFERKQKKAWNFLQSIGVRKEDLMDVDIRGLIVTMALQQFQEGSGKDN